MRVVVALCISLRTAKNQGKAKQTKPTKQKPWINNVNNKLMQVIKF